MAQKLRNSVTHLSNELHDEPPHQRLFFHLLLVIYIVRSISRSIKLLEESSGVIILMHLRKREIQSMKGERQMKRWSKYFMKVG